MKLLYFYISTIPVICIILKLNIDRWLEKGFFFATAKVTTRRK